MYGINPEFKEFMLQFIVVVCILSVYALASVAGGFMQVFAWFGMVFMWNEVFIYRKYLKTNKS